MSFQGQITQAVRMGMVIILALIAYATIVGNALFALIFMIKVKVYSLQAKRSFWRVPVPRPQSNIILWAAIPSGCSFMPVGGKDN